MVAPGLIYGISPRVRYRNRNQGTGENDQNSGRHKRRSATLLTMGFSSALAVTKANAGFFCLVDQIYGVHQAEHRQL